MACEYCKKPKVLLTFNGYSVFIVAGRLVVQSQAQAELSKNIKLDGKAVPVYPSAWIHINHCPMCGEKITPPESRDK